MFTRRRDEHFSESRKKAHARSFSFISKKLSKREGRRRRKEGREGQRERERREFFHLFFCASFSQRKLLSLLSFSPSFLSLFSLSRAAAFVCVFLLEFSPHEIELFKGGGGSHSHPIIVLIFPRYKSKQQQQHAKRAFYSVNARNKNRDTRARFKAESPRENCSTDDIRLL